jgi:hypothetical protein
MRNGPILLILIASISLSPRVLQTAAATDTRELLIERRYLNLPVKNHAPKHRVKLLVDGQIAREFEIELAEREPDFWVFLDLAPFQGKRATIEVDALAAGSSALSTLEQSDQIKGGRGSLSRGIAPAVSLLVTPRLE